MKQKGFTLIELLTVISIIGLLSSIIISEVNVARYKSIDTKRRQEVLQISKAITLFYNEYGRMPRNYNKGECGLGYCQGFDPTGNGWFAACDADLPNIDPVGNATMNSVQAYNASMQELVNAGFLPSIPRSPSGAGYCYFAWPQGSAVGAVIATELPSISPTTIPLSPACADFCNATFNIGASNGFCVCQPY